MRRYHYYSPLVLQKVGYIIFYIFYKLFVRIEVKGREHLTGLKGPVILASNHTSELDVTAIPLILPFFSALYPIYFVANPEEKFKMFGWRSYIYGGFFFQILGGYSIHSGSRDYGVALEDHIALLKKGRTLWIAPEGKRTRDGRMNPAHGGLGYLTYVTNATVVPISIDTFFDITPFDFFMRKRKVVLTVARVFLANEVVRKDTIHAPSVDDFKAGAQLVLNEIQKNMSASVPQTRFETSSVNI